MLQCETESWAGKLRVMKISFLHTSQALTCQTVAKWKAPASFKSPPSKSPDVHQRRRQCDFQEQAHRPFRRMTRRGFSLRKPLRLSGPQTHSMLDQARRPFRRMTRRSCSLRKPLRISGPRTQPMLGQARRPFRRMTSRGFSLRKPLRVSGAPSQPMLDQARRPFQGMARRGFSKRKPLRVSGAQNQPMLDQTRNQRGAEVFTRSEDWVPGSAHI